MMYPQNFQIVGNIRRFAMAALLSAILALLPAIADAQDKRAVRGLDSNAIENAPESTQKGLERLQGMQNRQNGSSRETFMSPVFQMDNNGDNIVTRQEAITAQQNTFSMFDKDRDGRITRNELDQYLDDISQSMRMARGRQLDQFENDMARALGTMDKNNDGVIMAAEFVGSEIEMFNLYDTNNDGIVSREEAQFVDEQTSNLIQNYNTREIRPSIAGTPAFVQQYQNIFTSLQNGEVDTQTAASFFSSAAQQAKQEDLFGAPENNIFVSLIPQDGIPQPLPMTTMPGQPGNRLGAELPEMESVRKRRADTPRGSGSNSKDESKSTGIPGATQKPRPIIIP